MLKPATATSNFVDALAARDFDALGEALAPGVRFRGLTPPALRESADRDSAVYWFKRWFGDCTELRAVWFDETTIGDRTHLAYRLEGVENGEPFVVEQHTFCVLEDGLIASMDLLCSDFHPR